MASPQSGSQGLKVIALISGGKDSLFSILHCQAQGHQVVALANLHPSSLPGNGGDSENDAIEDLDSFMYQTIGHNVVPLYAEALGIPLFREAITGSAVDTSREYSLKDNGDDETEDLVPLFEKAIEATGANAVSTGAILSTYQRTRVEAIAIRLGLTPLSYLWQYLYLPPYSQTSLLDDIRDVGQVARIIKVASGGLDQSFLWQDVADLRNVTKMRKRMAMYGGGEGGALIGEGGEFETLAVSGPAPLWKKTIAIEDVQVVVGEGGTASSRLRGARLVDKKSGDHATKQVRIPYLLDDEFEQVLQGLKQVLQGLDQALRGLNIRDVPIPSSNATISKSLWAESPQRDIEAMKKRPTTGTLHLANIMSAPHGSAQDQMTDIIHQIGFKLHGLGINAANIIHSTILLRSMSSFAAINPIYGSLFSTPNPPSRVTVSCGELLPESVHVVVSLIVSTGNEEGRTRGLHVQSRSYWAPANIGPYSQAISVPLTNKWATSEVPRLVYVAGQIPLVPATMDMVTKSKLPIASGETKVDDFTAQSVLSLQHLWRIGRAMDVTAWTGAIAFLSKCPAKEALRRASIACNTWEMIHQYLEMTATAEELISDTLGPAEDVDVWDVKNKVANLSTEEKETRPRLPDFSKIKVPSEPDPTLPTRPTVFVAMVDSLPRDAQIEWCSTGISAKGQVEYSSDPQLDRMYSKPSACHYADECMIYVDGTDDIGSEVAYWSFERMETMNLIAKYWKTEDTEVLALYITKPVPRSFSAKFGAAMLVPCYKLWRMGGDSQMKAIEALVITR